MTPNRYGNVDPRIIRIFELQTLAWDKLESAEYSLAVKAAHELLELISDETLSDIVADRSNARNCAFTVLGINACEIGDFEVAISCLHESVKIESSPQLASFGPTMVLAKELLIKKQAWTEVEKFLEECGRFWRCDMGILKKWKSDIRNMRVPDFGVNLKYLH